jgi:hypothetical protein
MKGFITMKDGLLYYHDGQDVFRTLKTRSVGVRWVCSIRQWNLCCSAFGLPKVRCAI